MKRFSFPYTISFGKLEHEGGFLSHALSDENAERLIRSANEGDRHYLSDDPFISDICDEVYDAVIRKLVNQLKKDPTSVKDSLSWKEGYDPEKTIGLDEIKAYLDQYPIIVSFPRSLQLKKPKARPEMIAKYVIVEEDQAKEMIQHDHYDNDVVILTDEGKTLYYVPRKFSGKIVVPSSVRKVRNTFLDGAVEGRNGITEIVIEDGMEEIDRFAFRRCKGLKRVTIPASVKKIGHLAFAYCESLEEVVLSEGLEEIYYSSFEGCYSLEMMKLPSTLKATYKMDFRDIYIMGMDTRIIEQLGGNWIRTKLHVLPGAVAEKYAIENGIRYDIIKDKQREEK